MKITDLEIEWLNENVEKVDFLSFFDPDEISALVGAMKPRLFQGNDVIIKEGETGKNFFFIYNGRVSVWLSRNEKQKRLARLVRGDFFGEISLVTGKATTAHVIANGPTKVFFIDSHQFVDIARKKRDLIKHLIDVIKKRMTEREAAIKEMEYGDLNDITNAIQSFLKFDEKAAAEAEAKKAADQAAADAASQPLSYTDTIQPFTPKKPEQEIPPTPEGPASDPGQFS